MISSTLWICYSKFAIINSQMMINDVLLWKVFSNNFNSFDTPMKLLEDFVSIKVTEWILRRKRRICRSLGFFRCCLMSFLEVSRFTQSSKDFAFFTFATFRVCSFKNGYLAWHLLIFASFCWFNFLDEFFVLWLVYWVKYKETGWTFSRFNVSP